MGSSKKRVGRKKLSRQFVFMVFIVQIFLVFFLLYLIRVESLQIYLTAKNDSLLTDMNDARREMYAMRELPWAMEYWETHYEDIGLNNTWELNFILAKSEIDHWTLYASHLPSDHEEAAAILNDLSPEEQKALAENCYLKLTRLFSSTHDSEGYEGSGCFMPLDNGMFMDLVYKDRESNYNFVPMNVSSNGMYEYVMNKFFGTSLSNGDLTTAEFTSSAYNINGERHSYYQGFAPVVIDGKVRAVIQIQYNYDSILRRINEATRNIIILLLVIYILVCVTFILRSNKIASKPIAGIQSAVREYISTGNRSSVQDKLDSIYSKNEIGVLAGDIGHMITEIDEYIGEVREADRKVKTLSVEIIEALASAVDAKDPYTNGHSRRVAEYSQKLAEAVGKNRDECDQIFFAALLHDVGKIGIPNEILTKNTRLTDEEFATIKKHPVYGADILGKIKDYPWMSIGARYHHERYDGTGYPDGLAGEEIPEVGRIIAVADAYDAMTSNRSYREAIPQHIVREELVKGIGTQFDPVYAGIMIHMIDLDIEYKMRESVDGSNVENKGATRCDSVYNSCTEGIGITEWMADITFTAVPDESPDRNIPTLIVFDCLDALVHPGEENNKDLLYFEYAKIRMDGKLENGNVRKGELRMLDDAEAAGVAVTDDDGAAGCTYRVKAARSRDHVVIRACGNGRAFEVILALTATSRYVFISISGEKLELRDINVEPDPVKTEAEDIPRIAEELSYINGCTEGDIPSIQADGPRLATTPGIPVEGEMTVLFHTMSYPTARLVWHCPYFSIFGSSDGTVTGDDFHEYLLLKMDGENWDSEEKSENEVIVERTADFKGWKSWLESNKQGVDCTLTIRRENNVIFMQTENNGICLKSRTVITDDSIKDLYLALTGDQCAISNIRIMRMKD